MKLKEQFEIYIRQFVQPTQIQLAVFLNFMQVEIIKKNENLINVGDKCEKAWFVGSGILRHYLIKDNKEGTVWFSFKNDITTEIESLVTGQPAAHAIVAVTDCELLSITKENLEYLYEKEKVWERFGRLTSVHYLLLQMRRVNDLTFKTGVEKYNDFITQHPEAQIHIPLHQIADFIGVKQETLSRIRKKRF